MAKRRSNGEGNIRKRKDRRWEGRYTAGFDSATGKQVFKNVLGKTQKEVKEKLKKALAESQKLDFTRTGKYTVRQWMEMFLVYGKHTGAILHTSLLPCFISNYRPSFAEWHRLVPQRRGHG